MEITMKKTSYNTGHKNITIFGHNVLLDFGEQKISMEEGKTEEEMDIIMWYLVEEGFIDTETKTLRQLE